jgi:hypothetical protein
MGGGVSNAVDMYQSLKRGRGDRHYSTDDNAISNKELAAMALALDRARAYQAAGYMQSVPESAAYNYPRWMEILGITLSSDATISEIKRQIVGVRKGNGIPMAVNIERALTAALGEPVTIITAQQAVRVKTTGVILTFDPLSDGGSGSLENGTYYLFAAAASNTHVSNYTVLGGFTATNGAILVGNVDVPSGYDWIEYHMSVEAGSTVAAPIHKGNGSPFVISHLPRNNDGPGLHHISALVSNVTDDVKRTIHNVLGTMLPSWTTYDVIDSSPFILDTTIPTGSPLGTGGL